MRKTDSSELEDTLRNMVAVPPASPEFVNSLWERMAERPARRELILQKRSLVRSIWSRSGGPVHHRGTRSPLLLISLILLIILGVFFVTPAGRVVAEQILAFFIHTASDEKPLPTSINQTTPTATIENPTPTSPMPDQKSSGQAGPIPNSLPTQGVAQIEYPLKEPQTLPPGYTFSYARYIPESKNTLFVYAYQLQAKGEMIMLTLSPTLIQDEIGPNAAVHKIKVNGHDGSMVQGAWLALAGEAHETWEPRVPVTTLRWFDGEVYIKLQFHLNEPTSPANLSFAQMLKVAESIQATDPGKSRLIPSVPNQDFHNMEAQVGYLLLEPGILPAGYLLVEVEQVPDRQQVDARYRPATSDETGPRLTISQIPLSGLPEIKPYINDQVEQVNIIGRQGRLMMGVNDGGSYPSWFLFWETQDLAMSIWYYPGPNISAEEAKRMMIEIAKSMK